MKERNLDCYQDYRRKNQVMDSQDIIKMGDRAKNETEAFINRHLNDKAKGWPKNRLYGPNSAEFFQKEGDKNVRYQKCS